MKKLKKLLLVLLMMVVIFPFNVKAEEEKKEEEKKEPVKVYIFHGSTCSFCKAAMEWFGSIEEEYGDYFDLVDYEVWGSSENAALMEEVSAFRGDNATGVPYIIVGDYSYPNGFAADSPAESGNDKTMGDELIERIMETYEDDSRYDVMLKMNDKPDHSNAVTLVSVVIIVGFVAMAIVTRRQSK